MSLHEKSVKWGYGMEAYGLKVNTGKTKLMFGCDKVGMVEEKGEWHWQ